ncbi:MAG: ABC transporter permease [Lentisphaerae bacterium]|nr:ABC transporter permease [Lentisphaerota bacterium]
MVPFSLYLALKYLRPQRSFISVVTVISVVGVLLGVAILLIVLSVMTGFDNMWRTKILSFKPHLMITAPYGVLEDEDAICEKVAKVPGITGVSPAIETRILLQVDGRTAAPIVVGLDPARASSVTRIPEHMTSGHFYLEDRRAILGADLAFSMQAAVGDTMLAYSPLNVLDRDELYLPEELELSGIFNMGMRDFDGSFLLTSLDVARDLVGLETGVHAIYVMTDDAFRFAEYAQRVQAAIGPDYMVRTWREVDSVLFEALSHEKTMMFLLLVFITIVAIFCVTNTLIVITVQKTNEIGLLKALGFPSGKIMAAFVWHGWIQCLLGTLSGIGVGLLVLHNLPNLVELLRHMNVEVFPKEIYGLSEIPWSTSPGEIFRIALFVLVFCTLSSVLPAYRAARLDPVEALRNE